MTMQTAAARSLRAAQAAHERLDLPTTPLAIRRTAARYAGGWSADKRRSAAARRAYADAADRHLAIIREIAARRPA